MVDVEDILPGRHAIPVRWDYKGYDDPPNGGSSGHIYRNEADGWVVVVRKRSPVEFSVSLENVWESREVDAPGDQVGYVETNADAAEAVILGYMGSYGWFYEQNG